MQDDKSRISQAQIVEATFKTDFETETSFTTPEFKTTASQNTSSIQPTLWDSFGIEKLLKLAKLVISDEEKSKYASQLSKIDDYLKILLKVETASIEPTYNVTKNTNITRDDSESKSLTQDEALGNSPQVKNGLFTTKGVFEE